MRKGFTLVELMIVIAIIILIASIAVPQYMEYIKRAQLATIRSDLQTLHDVLALYIQDWGSYPVNDADIVIDNGILKTNSLLYRELTAQGATVNNSTNKTITGLQGGKVYLEPDQFKAIVNHLGSVSAHGSAVTMIYQSRDGSTYVLDIVSPIAGDIFVTPQGVTIVGF